MRHLLDLAAAILAILSRLVSAKSNSSLILDFDELSPPTLSPSPIFPLPTHYHSLHFSSFSVFDPASAALSHIIVPIDRNCAASRPNALLGARVGGEDGVKAAFEILSTDGSSLGGNGEEKGDLRSNYTWFNFIGMSIKPMAAPPGEEQIAIWVRGYKADVEDDGYSESRSIGKGGDDGTLLWRVDFPVGYHLAFEASMPEEWRMLRKVEVWADYGPDKLDWEFCVDDLVLVFGPDAGDDGEEAWRETQGNRGKEEQVRLDPGVTSSASIVVDDIAH